MSINGIGSGLYSNYYGSNRISSLYKLQMQQALQRTNTSTWNRSNVTQYMNSSSQNFLKSYNSSMSSLMTNASTLRSGNTASPWNKTAATSSDTSVLNVEQKYRLSTQDTYQVDVKALATKQENVSDGFQTNALAQNDAALTISNGKGNFSFKVEAKNAEGNFKTNHQMLKEMAAAVNESGMGVKASVSTKDGVSQLTFTAEKTGKDNGFRVEGAFAEAGGLSKASTEAQDARYTVSKNGQQAREYTSAENKVSLDYDRMSATLKKVGKADISIGADTEGVVSATKKLVESYNKTISMLQSNVDRGYGVERQLNQMQNHTMSDKSLELIGITKDSDGKMSLDETALRDALKKDPSLTKDILGGNFGLAQNLFEGGRQGLSQSGASLLQNDVAQAQENSYSNPFRMMGLLNRSGAYTMTNYYTVGNFLNMLL